MSETRPILLFANRLKDGEAEKATFHGWGLDFMEFEAGPGNYTAAIVEKADGSVELRDVREIKFIDTP